MNAPAPDVSDSASAIGPDDTGPDPRRVRLTDLSPDLQHAVRCYLRVSKPRPDR